jgi:hypothetical protein
MLAAALLGLSGWIVPGQHLLAAREFDGGRQTVYGPAALHDVDDAPLALEVFRTPQAISPNTTVHGLPAELGDLSDDGQVYGRQVRWNEAGVTLALEQDGKPPDARMLALAESVQPVSPQRWHTLRVATGPPRRAPGYPLRSLYAVRLPSDTCTVTVHGAGAGLRTGPAAGGPEADRRRCARGR